MRFPANKWSGVFSNHTLLVNLLINPLVKDILPNLSDRGYDSNKLSNSDFTDAIWNFSNDADEVCDSVDYGVEDPLFLYANLEFKATDPVSNLEIYFDFEYRYSWGRLFCTQLSASCGEAFKNYDCPDHDLPSFLLVALEMQRKLALSPFMRAAEYLGDVLEKQNFNFIKVPASGMKFIDEFKNQISDDTLNGADNNTRTTVIKGLCSAFGEIVQSDITLEMNKAKGQCSITAIRNEYLGTHMLFLPGHMAQLHSPGKMCRLIREKHAAEKIIRLKSTGQISKQIDSNKKIRKRKK